MNPITNTKNQQKMTMQELESGNAGTNASWHTDYKDSAWVYIGGLSKDLTEGDVIAVFSQCGEVMNINLIRDKETGKSKGHAYLCYQDQNSTVLAVDNLNNIKILHSVLRVNHHNYKPPKHRDDLDETTKKLYYEGCAPKAKSPPPTIISPVEPVKPKKDVKKEKVKVKKEKKVSKKKIKVEKEKPKKPKKQLKLKLKTKKVKEESSSSSSSYSSDTSYDSSSEEEVKKKVSKKAKVKVASVKDKSIKKKKIPVKVEKIKKIPKVVKTKGSKEVKSKHAKEKKASKKLKKRSRSYSSLDESSESESDSDSYESDEYDDNVNNTKRYDERDVHYDHRKPVRDEPVKPKRPKDVEKYDEKLNDKRRHKRVDRSPTPPPDHRYVAEERKTAPYMSPEDRHAYDRHNRSGTFEEAPPNREFYERDAAYRERARYASPERLELIPAFREEPRGREERYPPYRNDEPRVIIEEEPRFVNVDYDDQIHSRVKEMPRSYDLDYIRDDHRVVQRDREFDYRQNRRSPNRNGNAFPGGRDLSGDRGRDRRNERNNPNIGNFSRNNQDRNFGDNFRGGQGRGPNFNRDKNRDNRGGNFEDRGRGDFRGRERNRSRSMERRRSPEHRRNDIPPHRSGPKNPGPRNRR